jgi:hypothetical protein
VKAFLVLLIFVFSGSFVSAQETAAVTKPDSATQSADPKLHEDVLKLVELMNARQNIIASQQKIMPNARETLMKSSPIFTPQFGDEWSKRMMADSSIDEYLTVIIGVYEKHFSNEEIEEFIQIQRDVNDKKTPTVPDALKAKLAKDGIAIQSEVIGGCTQVGARLGAEIAQQIGKEHPEWLKTPESSVDAVTKK